jgi:hypothetical protein
MTLPVIRFRTLLILGAILVVLLFMAWTAYQFDRAAIQSVRHDYSYSIELSYNSTMEDVTLMLPVPEQDHTPFFMESILNKTAYGVSPDWNYTIVRQNGTPMLAIKAARMVPEYHGYPIAIEPGASVLPTTLVPGHEYSGDTPILVPVTIAVIIPVEKEINTSDPVGHEPVLFPDGGFTPGSCTIPPCDGQVYDHRVPVYLSYTAEHPVSLSLRVSIQGTNAIWRGGWTSHGYSDTVVIETVSDTRGWIMGEGRLFTSMDAKIVG